jgi:hypothetical protein
VIRSPKSLRANVRDRCRRCGRRCASTTIGGGPITAWIMPNFFDHDLRRLFSDAPEHARRPTAAGFLRRLGPKLRREVSHWTGEYQYTINQVLDGMIERCRELKLRVHRPQREAERSALILLTIQTMNYLHAGNHRVAL